MNEYTVNSSEIAKSFEKHRKYAKTGLHTKESNNIVWEKLLANSKLVMPVDNGLYHYEIYMIAEKLPNGRFVSKSRIKFCVKEFVYCGKVFRFLLNPVDGISRCIEQPEVVVKWKEVKFEQPVLNREALNFEEQLNIHLVRLENLIRDKFEEEVRKSF